MQQVEQPCSASRAVQQSEWIEVTHAFHGDILERSAYFMYAARGSGVWYETGASLFVSDTSALAAYLNEVGYPATTPRRQRHGPLPTHFYRNSSAHVLNDIIGWKTMVVTRARQLLPQYGISTVHLTHHADGNSYYYGAANRSTCRHFYTHEVLG